MKRVALWLIAFPLMLAGTECAHALAYRIVYPVAAVRWQMLAASGHGYMDWAPLVVGLAGAVVFAGLASTVIDGACRRTSRPLPAWAFGLLPIAGFAIQEFIERWLATNTLPWWMVEQPTFRVGLLLQLPFAALAYVAARLLLRVGRTLGRALAGRSLPPALLGVPPTVRPSELVLLRPSALRLGWSVRGPPVPSV